MTRQIIRTPAAPHSALFSQAIKVGSTIYVSGIVGIDPRTNQLAGLTIQEQTRQALTNCENILLAGGAKLENVVEVHVLLAEPNDFAGRGCPDFRVIGPYFPQEGCHGDQDQERACGRVAEGR
jgi:2-iminobutanoate/2-iminopropanoate deaminase